MSQGSSGFRIASNPTNGKKLKLEFDAEELLELFVNEIKILDKSGKIKLGLQKNEIKTTQVGKFFELDTKGIENGNYFLHIKIGDNLFKQEIIIN